MACLPFWFCLGILLGSKFYDKMLFSIFGFWILAFPPRSLFRYKRRRILWNYISPEIVARMIATFVVILLELPAKVCQQNCVYIDESQSWNLTLASETWPSIAWWIVAWVAQNSFDNRDAQNCCKHSHIGAFLRVPAGRLLLSKPNCWETYGPTDVIQAIFTYRLSMVVAKSTFSFARGSKI